MPTALTQKINSQLANNPQLVQVLFQDLFGKHMMRYYGDKTSRFRVEVGNTSLSSYMHFDSSTIYIAMHNVMEQLKLGINVYAVAYHELAHILYTSDNIRDTIRDDTKQLMYDDKYRVDTTLVDEALDLYRQKLVHKQGNQIHMLWNIVEDERIERKLMREHKFLVDIVDPLKTIIKDDSKIMSWRLGKYAQKYVANQRIVALCEEYISTYDNATIHNVNDREQLDIAPRKYLASLFYELHKLVFDPNDKTPPPPPKGGDEPTQDDEPTQPTQGGDEPTQPTQGGDEPTQPTQPQDDTTSDDKAREQREDDLNKIIQQQIDKAQELIQTVAIETSYENSILREHDHIVVSDEPHFKNFFFVEIPLITQERTTIRGGITQAQRKSFKSDISSKINVPRLLESVASKQEPKIFYNKGKDALSLRKVVIFEDVSSSTCGGGSLFSSIFSMIAYSLAKSFDECDWWIYGDLLAKKHKRDYSIPSVVVGRRYHMASGTQSDLLANVMRKYAKEKALFVVITDGDIQSLTQDSSLFKQFVNQTAFIGQINSNELKNIKHKCIMDASLLDHMEYLRHYRPYQDKIAKASRKANDWYDKQVNNDLQKIRIIATAYSYGLQAKESFDVILHDSRLRQYIVNAVKTIASVMKGVMK